jgi:hypothetical protein
MPASWPVGKEKTSTNRFPATSLDVLLELGKMCGWPQSSSAAADTKIGLSVLTLGLVNFSRGSEMHFARIHQSFAKRWMRMNRFRQIANFTAHLDRQYRLCDQFTGTWADNSASEDTMRFWID